MVLSATTNLPPANASVQFSLGNESMSATTDSYGTASFTLSPYMLSIVDDGAPATIQVSAAGYISLSDQRRIRPDHPDIIQVFPSPELEREEHRLVLSWDTNTDLDLYALLYADWTTDEILCKISFEAKDGCPIWQFGNLDIGAGAYGPETITWNDRGMDAYRYKLYVHDAGERGTVAGTGARITLYGKTGKTGEIVETEVKMQVADGDSGEPWWEIGTFRPFLGTSSFSIIDRLVTSDPDTRVSTPQPQSKKKNSQSRGAGAKDNKWFEG